ncbi:YegJ family protein [Parasulfitobacter algicola]|uniref:DUF2314 domain-containing protein n=1 Tax=Parasulfitobacter algicola TaxID=2614809 RepID=A0ABX2IVZ5_9RHOB|nr:DUF2314 domain-containing protein [Sulfitobacter algicola]NSX56465.1 DUF2314 domain-containing protein [Sulfitobacter algicola]
MRILSILFAACLMVLPVGLLADKADPVWNFEASDPVMNDAIAEARATLPIFLNKVSVSNPAQELFALKVALPTPDAGHEHVWVAYFNHQNNSFEGALMNQPAMAQGNRGDVIEFTNADISDWFFWQDEKMHGAFTMRVMLPQLSAEDQAYYKGVLAPKPVR